MPNGEIVVEAAGVRKDYGDTHALNGVALTVHRGEVLALLGPNGAGKTTFVEILEGLRTRTHGIVRVLGVDPMDGDAAWRARIGIVLQSGGGFDDLSVEETLRHVARFYPAPMAVDRVVEMVGLGEKRTTRCKHLSGGQRRRLDVGLGLIGDPDLIFLDEPTTGFDPTARHQAWDVVRELTSLGKTVLLTTHYLDEADALADRVAVIVGGRVVADAPRSELGGPQRQRTRVSFLMEGVLDGAALPAMLRDVDLAGRRATIATDEPTATVAVLAAWARGLGAGELPGLTVTRPSLEDVYLELIAAREAAGE